MSELSSKDPSNDPSTAEMSDELDGASSEPADEGINIGSAAGSVEAASTPAAGESAVASPVLRRRAPSRPLREIPKVVDDSATDFGWYILHTLSGNEEKVKQTMATTLAREGLADMMQDVLIPVEDVVEVKRGKKHIKKRKLFPGYVFVRMKATEPVLKQIRRLPNLARFVGGIGGSGPVPVTDAEIGRIRVFMTETKERPKIIYEVGETVRIISGPFMDFNGTILDMDVDKGRLKIQVEIFGRATPVDLDFDQVEKV